VTAAIWLGALLAAGMIAVALRLPPLVGFLVTGFALNATGVPHLEAVDTLADLGVTLLLFTIGLKLDLRQLLGRAVWGTALAHMALTVPLVLATLGGLGLLGVTHLADADVRTLALLAFALSFSSTVFVLKVLEERSESQSLYGRIAISILIIQDLAAVVFIGATADESVSPWAALLLLLPLVRRPLRVAWQAVPHGELQALFGIFVALVPGYALFESLNVKGDLGALVMGVLLAGNAAASELSRALVSIKDLLLVGFFVNIGYTGTLDLQGLLLGVLLVILIPGQSLLYMWLLRLFRLRRRTSVLAGLALANHSEFALIIIAVGVEADLLDAEWLVIASVAVAVSFVLSSVLNNRTSTLLPRITARMPQVAEADLHPDDRYIDLGDAQAVVLGMGRLGQSAYHRLEDHYGLRVLAVEISPQRVEQLRGEGMNIVVGDAEDEEFWQRLARASQVEVAILAMPFHGSNAIALKRLQESGFSGRVVAIALYDDHARALLEGGATQVLQIYDGAGVEMADRAMQQL
jgi:glutathione-regulated potassium-efflux system ancillary protein KefC